MGVLHVLCKTQTDGWDGNGPKKKKIDRSTKKNQATQPGGFFDIIGSKLIDNRRCMNLTLKMTRKLMINQDF